jgi:hypothetical protein
LSDKKNHKITIKTASLSKQLVENENLLKSLYLRDTNKCENSKTLNRSNNTYGKYPQKLNTKSPRDLVATKSKYLQNSNLNNINFIPSTIERLNKDTNDIFNLKKSLDQTNLNKNHFLKPLPKIDTVNKETKPSKYLLIILGPIKLCRLNRQKDYHELEANSIIVNLSSRNLSVNKSNILNNSNITYDLKQESTFYDDKKSEKKNLSINPNASNKVLETSMTNTNKSESNGFLKISREKEKNAKNIMGNSPMNQNMIVNNPPLLQNIIDVRKFSILDVQACESAVLITNNAEDFSKKEECKRYINHL